MSVSPQFEKILRQINATGADLAPPVHPLHRIRALEDINQETAESFRRSNLTSEEVDVISGQIIRQVAIYRQQLNN
ncbi:MAG: hypothetical protein WAV41_00095 [Microgenomates group bacterium]